LEASGLQARLKETSAPDLILIDADAAVTLAYLAELKSLAPNSGLILWVDWISQEFVRDAIKSGVRGILRQNASADLCLECLTQVAAGQLWLEDEMNQKLLCAKAIRLSPRERQLVGLLTEGLRNKEIAVRMNITEGTAKAYLSRLFEKTGASDRFELAMFALKNLETNPATGPSRGPRIFLPLRNTFARQA
jgi:DNA-binding NarL/FixJ family response regulator